MLTESTNDEVVQVAVEAIATLDRYLGFFSERGYPGRACLRSGWVREGAVVEDRARVELLRRRLTAIREHDTFTVCGVCAAALDPESEGIDVCETCWREAHRG